MLLRSENRLFQGKRESAWIDAITYGDNPDQTDQWRSFGPDGARLLARALREGNRPTQRFYRSGYRWLAPKLPARLSRRLPRPANTTSIRMRAAMLLSRLDSDMRIVKPAFVDALKDESPGVQMIVLSWFGDHLEQMGAAEKRRLLPHFIAAMRAGHWGMRNNAAIALKHYPDQAEKVVPVLVKGLQDPIAKVRLLSAEALHHIDPDAAATNGAVSVVVKVLETPDDQVAWRAAQLPTDQHRDKVAEWLDMLLESVKRPES